jgi:gamma-glutamyltranspeptidase
MNRSADKQVHQGWPWLGAYESHPRLGSARPVIGESGMVSTPHHQATMIGLDVLKAGGNAVDAAIAASAALMVALPMQCSPGGDAIWMIRSPDGQVSVLDASGRAPLSASADALRARGLDAIPHRGPESVTVPGAVDGWVQACGRFGTRALPELLEPAARLAENGTFVSRHVLASLRAAEPVLERWGAKSLWSSGNASPSLYDKLRQPRLADALRDIGTTMGRSLYDGPIAGWIVNAVARAGGNLELADLRSHRSDWLDAITCEFRSATIHASPPHTQGVALLETLRIIETVSAEPLALASASTAHLLIEALADALEDRDVSITDRDLMRGAVECLYSADHIATLAQNFAPARSRKRERSTASTKGLGDTAHLAIVDAQGWAVSLIQSLYFDYGSGIPVPEAGFTLQNRGAAFSLEAGAINELRPGVRPPTTLAPTMITREGRLSHVLGCMGGDGQIQTQVQLIVDMLDGGLDPQQAISRPRFFLDRADADGPRVLFEEGVEADTVTGLRQRGHTVAVLGPSEEIMGHAQVISCEPGGALVGGFDRRCDGQAAGW